ncbi:MAG: hypothetical protein K8R02_03490 [Anaerohalosphaeraceae bacterium]|nr:hypothetical protein [Anaerohalosphaeraceae bacterium]
MAKQLHIFIDNTPGRLESVTGKLGAAGIDVRAFAIQDMADYGLMKLIVSNPQQAYLALADMGSACALKDVLAISVPDKCGNLHKLMAVLAENNINIIDAYGFVLQPSNQGVCILEIENMAETNAEKIVADAGFDILDDQQLRDI